MKKSTWVVFCAMFAAGALALFAGCGKKEVGEAEKAEVLAALETAEFSAFDASIDATAVDKKVTSRVTDKKTQWSTTDKTTAKQAIDVTAYERGGLLFGDSFTNIVDKDGVKRFELAFVRGKSAFYGDGTWEEVGVKAGNFGALVKECRENSFLLAGDVRLAVDDLGSYGNSELTAMSKVYKAGSGYRVEYDVIDALATVFEKLEGGAAYYKEHPDCTLGELFAASDLEGFDEVFSYVVETLGGEPSVRELFGDPYEFGATVREAQKDPEAFLIEGLFGFIVVGSNEGTMDFTVTIDVDKKYAVKKIESTLNVFMSERSYWGYAYGDYALTVLDREIEVKMKVKPLSSDPALTDLTWLYV